MASFTSPSVKHNARSSTLLLKSSSSRILSSLNLGLHSFLLFFDSFFFHTQIFGSARLMTEISWFSLLLLDFSLTAACISASLSDFSIFPRIYYPLYTLDTTALQFLYRCPTAASNSINLRCTLWTPTVYSTLVPYILHSDSTKMLWVNLWLALLGLLYPLKCQIVPPSDGKSLYPPH